MATSAPSMPTVGEIARRLGASTHRVEYVIRARGIRPRGWAGNARVFDEKAVEVIADELERIGTRNRRAATNVAPQVPSHHLDACGGAARTRLLPPGTATRIGCEETQGPRKESLNGY